MNEIAVNHKVDSRVKFDESSWVTRPVWLKFAFGELKLFSRQFQLSVLDAHFTDLKLDAFCEWSEWESIPASADGVLIRSQPITNRLPRLTSYSTAIRYVPAQYQRFYVEVENSFPDYLKKFSSHSRSNRKREVKKFSDLCGGALDYREYRKPHEVEEFMILAQELSRKTFQERLLDAGLPQGDAYRNSIVKLAEDDRIRAYLLFYGGRAVSYLIGEIRRPGVLLILYMGYDPELRSWSPGTVLNYKAVESVFAEKGLRMIDFTEGEGKHKQYFATASTLCADVYFFRRSIRNRLVLGMHSALDDLSGIIVRTLDRLGIKVWVKKFIRSIA